MNLTDAGSMVALIDAGQGDTHRRCVAVHKKLKGPMLTTWPCFTEAMYFLGELSGWRGQAALWQYVETGAIVFHSPDDDEWRRMRVLMEKYHDTPMDFADASLVTAAEVLGLRTVFTIDSDFYVYRIDGNTPIVVIP